MFRIFSKKLNRNLRKKIFSIPAKKPDILPIFFRSLLIIYYLRKRKYALTDNVIIAIKLQFDRIVCLITYYLRKQKYAMTEDVILAIIKNKKDNVF